MFGKFFYEMFTIFSAFFALLFFFDDSLSNLPIGFYHLFTHGRISMLSAFFYNRTYIIV